MTTIEDLQKLDIRVGKILTADLLPNSKYTTHKLVIDFGEEVGTKVSGARLVNYTIEELNGKIVCAVINLPPRQIGKIVSEVLTLGVPDEKNDCILIIPEKEVQLGGKVY